MTNTSDIFRKHYSRGKELLFDKMHASLFLTCIFNVLASTNMFFHDTRVLMTDILSQHFSAIKVKVSELNMLFQLGQILLTAMWKIKFSLKYTLCQSLTQRFCMVHIAGTGLQGEKNLMVRGSDVLKREVFTAVGVMKCNGKNHLKKKRQSWPFRCFSI